jgi:anti-sigma regulatory factor (Ser/Thr protein kinase)
MIQMGILTTAPSPQQAERRNYARNNHAPGLARAHVRMRLGLWNLGHMADSVALVADELVSNAVRHSAGLNVMLWLALTDTSVVVHVWDANPQPPVQREAGEYDEDGRGLAIVTALSVEKGVYPLAQGKVTWAEVMR